MGFDYLLYKEHPNSIIKKEINIYGISFRFSLYRIYYKLFIA